MADRKTEFWDIESLSELRRRCQKPGCTLRLFEWLRWPDGRICPNCEGRDYLPIEGRQKTGLYHCRGCRKPFSATSGTPLHKTKLPLETWMEAAFIIASSSKGVSSVILAQQIGVTQPTAWKVGHAIRLMMRRQTSRNRRGVPPLCPARQVRCLAPLERDPSAALSRRARLSLGSPPSVPEVRVSAA